MDLGQTLDIVDTPTPNRINWPSSYDFHYLDDILKWRDISTGIYKILDHFDRGQNRYGGQCLILKLEPFSGPIIFGIMCTNDTRDRVSIDASNRHLHRPAIDMSTDT